jgi:hypothetical protein
MRGNPWIHISAVVLGVFLMAGPTWFLTKAHERVPAPPGASTPETACQITLTFAHPPESCSLSSLGQNIPLTPGADGEYNGTLSIALPKEGADLLLKAKWPAHTPKTAVEVCVQQDNQTLADQTYWSTGSLTELVTVPPPPKS